ncbi:hypothetical protein [Furfurilactobacillus curtus]|uniref:Uncharacterized protein n=1 Tax=Furfurilactobacillus curtus TaxID=1746200 RepID=A0ABQ5JLU4_9LACO
MVKQGHYAKSSRQKRLRHLNQRLTKQNSRTIPDTQLSDFLTVRWHLTQHQPDVIEQTMLHFLRTWLEQAAQQSTLPWNLTVAAKATLAQFNRDVPWQFYLVLDQQWSHFQSFIQKELPAVPLSDRRRVSQLLTEPQWHQQLAQQLAVNNLLLLFNGDQHRLANVTQAQIEQLTTSLLADDQVNWSQVAALFAGTPFSIPVDADAESKSWLKSLMALAS